MGFLAVPKALEIHSLQINGQVYFPEMSVVICHSVVTWKIEPKRLRILKIRGFWKIGQYFLSQHSNRLVRFNIWTVDLFRLFYKRAGIFPRNVGNNLSQCM